MPGQCVLFIDDPLLATENGVLWLDNLLVRVTSPREYPFRGTMHIRGTQMYLTNTTLEGNGDGIHDCGTCGFFA